jgi:hypothetical protein
MIPVHGHTKRDSPEHEDRNQHNDGTFQPVIHGATFAPNGAFE